MTRAIAEHIAHDVDFTSTKELAGGSRGDVFSLRALKRLRAMLQDERASEYLSWLLADERFFKVRWLSVEPALRRPHYRLHCDTPEDYAFLQAVYGRLYDGTHIVDYPSVIRLLDASPEIVALNARIQQRSQDDVREHINLELRPLA
jgi:spore coat polysaccharide biosynthesis protein SpsF (cytidylyltransferase family)